MTKLEVSNIDRRKYCQLGSTDDSLQFITLSVHFCRTMRKAIEYSIFNSFDISQPRVADGRRALAKFSQSKACYKVAEGSLGGDLVVRLRNW